LLLAQKYKAIAFVQRLRDLEALANFGTLLENKP
jgi:hypothetical protein